MNKESKQMQGSLPYSANTMRDVVNIINIERKNLLVIARRNNELAKFKLLCKISW
ncbi:MAG: hypothetical protein ACR2HS_03760 [Gammaproteobacteria bacterium]